MDLLIDTYGTFIGATGERIALKFPKTKRKKEYAIRRLKKIVILRPSSISMHAVKLALDHDVDIVYLGSFGKPVGRIFSSNPRGIATLRRAQLDTSQNEERAMSLAKKFVHGKCKNQIYHLRHLSHIYKKDFSAPIDQASTLLETLPGIALSIKSRDQLFGVEGSIAERYWYSLRQLFKFPGRKPEGRDKFNSALNYAYGILYNEIERACLYVGLDPYLGLYHTDRYGKPALVLDLIEEFRVPIADFAIVPLFVAKELGKKGDFERVARGEYMLSAQGKSKVVGAVLKQLDQKVKFRGKQRDMRSIIEEQARQLAQHFQGRRKIYTPFDASLLF